MNFDFLKDDGDDDGTIRINTSGSRPRLRNRREPAKPGAAYEAFTKVASFVLTVALIGGCVSCIVNAPKQTEAEFNAADNGMLALTKAQSHIKKMLKAPRSARWPSLLEDGAIRHVGRLQDGTYVVHSFVDSQNDFGAMIRTWYKVHLRVYQDGHADILAAGFVE